MNIERRSSMIFLQFAPMNVEFEQMVQVLLNKLMSFSWRCQTVGEKSSSKTLLITFVFSADVPVEKKEKEKEKQLLNTETMNDLDYCR